VLNQFISRAGIQTFQHKPSANSAMVNPGFSLTMSNPGGELYTLDGTDPRKLSNLSTPGADVTLLGASAAKAILIPTTAPASTQGTIRADYWFGIGGTAVSNLTSNAAYPDSPGQTDYLTRFETPTNWADSYGVRLSGYLHPPVNGDYTFWIASDDGGELWLSRPRPDQRGEDCRYHLDEHAHGLVRRAKIGGGPLGGSEILHLCFDEGRKAAENGVGGVAGSRDRADHRRAELSPRQPWMDVVYDSAGRRDEVVGYENNPATR
jgi:hypothetical protein